MSEETVEVFQGMREARRERNREWKKENMAALERSGLTWRATNNGETLLFRAPGVWADFYPSTGRWRSGGKTYSGGAQRFIDWFRKECAS
jgi:hypothetical protein